MAPGPFHALIAKSKTALGLEAWRAQTCAVRAGRVFSTPVTAQRTATINAWHAPGVLLAKDPGSTRARSWWSQVSGVRLGIRWQSSSVAPDGASGESARETNFARRATQDQGAGCA